MPYLRSLRTGVISALTVGSLASLSGAGDTARSEPRSNVLLLIVDDLRAELGGPYGSEVVQSPNINGLARRGVTMLRAYCQFSMCSVFKPNLTYKAYKIYTDSRLPVYVQACSPVLLKLLELIFHIYCTYALNV